VDGIDDGRRTQVLGGAHGSGLQPEEHREQPQGRRARGDVGSNPDQARANPNPRAAGQDSVEVPPWARAVRVALGSQSLMLSSAVETTASTTRTDPTPTEIATAALRVATFGRRAGEDQPAEADDHQVVAHRDLRQQVEGDQHSP